MNVIVSPNAPKAIGPYSQAMVSNGMLYISGTAGVDPQPGKLQEGLDGSGCHIYCRYPRSRRFGLLESRQDDVLPL